MKKLKNPNILTEYVIKLPQETLFTAFIKSITENTLNITVKKIEKYFFLFLQLASLLTDESIQTDTQNWEKAVSFHQKIECFHFPFQNKTDIQYIL